MFLYLSTWLYSILYWFCMLNKEYLLRLAMIAVSLRILADFQPSQTTNGDSKYDAQPNITL